jgi:hypothetical protein
MRALGFALAIFILLLAAATRCNATDFASVKTPVGEFVYVTGATGVEIGGPVTALSSGQISIDRFTWNPDDVLRIERRGDRTWDGALIAGGLSTLFNPAIASSCGACFARWVGLWSTVGWLVDAGRVGRTTVYQRPRSLPRRSVITPAFMKSGKGRTGMGLTWSFRRLH